MGIGNIETVHGLILNPEALPGSPTTGQIAYNNSANKAYFWSGTAWIDMSGGLSVAAVGSSPNINAATVVGQVLNLEPADGTNPGVITAGTQTIGGNKTFSGTIGAANLSGTNTGDVTLATVGAAPNASGASLVGQVLNLQPADGTNPGVITAGTQTFGGAKTFSLGITAPGVAAPAATSLGLTSPLGAGASDICTKAGTSLADASVDAGAKLLSVRTGIGGTESEKLHVLKDGTLNTSGGLVVGGAYAGLGINAANTIRVGAAASGTSFYSHIGGHWVTGTSTAVFRSEGLGAGGSDVCVSVGTGLADASCDISAKILSVRTGIGGTESEKMYVNRNGALVVTGNVHTGSGGGVQAGTYGHGVNVSSYTNKVWGGWGLTGASNVHCIIGASTTDASTPATAKLLSIRTGITGTEVEKWSFSASSVLNCANSLWEVQAAGTSICRFGTGVGVNPRVDGYNAVYFDTANGGVGCNTAVKLTTEAADGASAVACEIDTVNAWSNASARLVSLRTNNVEKAAIMADGSFVGTGAGISTADTSAGWSVQRWYGTTTDATATEIFLNGVASSRATLANSSSVMFKISVVARDNTNHVSKAWEVTGLIHRGAAAANTAMDTTTTSIYQIGSGADTWTVATTADTTNGSLNLTVTGAAATTIRWSARLDRVLVNF